MQRFNISRQSRLFRSSAIRKSIQSDSLSPSLSKLFDKYSIKVNDDDFEHDLKEPLLKNLEKRGLLETVTNEELVNIAEKKTLGLYCGADPTAKSLHLGNLLPLMILLHFNLRGHNVTSLIGGATGAVGDPSGRTTERDAMAQETRLTNVDRIKGQFKKFFSEGVEYAKSRNPLILKEKSKGEYSLRNNHDWWKDIYMLDFLARYGKFIRINQMLARDSVKSRLSTEQGLGFNEFTYQILQAYDFYHLNKNHQVDIQVGGNDQYGNIVAGVDLISRMKKVKAFNKDRDAYGITVPLLTTSAGVKFGKSAGNAIFIDKELTPSYQIYQFMYNTTDEDVQKFMYKFSLLPLNVIDKIISKHNEDKRKRVGQIALAIEMCDLIHGEGEGFDNFIISEILFSKGPLEYSANEIISAFRKQNLVKSIERSKLFETPVAQILYELYEGKKSKGEIRRTIQNGSVSSGHSKVKISSNEEKINPDTIIDDKLILLRVGKQFHIIEVI